MNDECDNCYDKNINDGDINHNYEDCKSDNKNCYDSDKYIDNICSSNYKNDNNDSISKKNDNSINDENCSGNCTRIDRNNKNNVDYNNSDIDFF